MNDRGQGAVWATAMVVLAFGVAMGLPADIAVVTERAPVGAPARSSG